MARRYAAAALLCLARPWRAGAQGLAAVEAVEASGACDDDTCANAGARPAAPAAGAARPRVSFRDHAVQRVSHAAALRLTVDVDANGVDYGAFPMQTCEPVVQLHCAELVFSMQEVTVELPFEGCVPGQHSALALAFPKGTVAALSLVALRNLAGGGAHDEVVFTIVPDDSAWVDPLGLKNEVSAWSFAQRYTTGNFERSQIVTSWMRQRQLFSKLFYGRSLRVLEFGCGTLELAAHLRITDYACVEPNEWLAQAGLARAAQATASPDDSERHWLALHRSAEAQKGTWLLHNADYDATGLGFSADYDASNLPGVSAPRFDVVYSHSVLSHAGTRALAAYFKAAAEALDQGGFLVASLCLCGACGAGDRVYTRDCSGDGALGWVYPWTSWHSAAAIKKALQAAGLEVVHLADETAAEIRRGMMDYGQSSDWHDWLVASKPGAADRVKLSDWTLQRLKEWV